MAAVGRRLVEQGEDALAGFVVVLLGRARARPVAQGGQAFGGETGAPFRYAGRRGAELYGDGVGALRGGRQQHDTGAFEHPTLSFLAADPALERLPLLVAENDRGRLLGHAQAYHIILYFCNFTLEQFQE